MMASDLQKVANMRSVDLLASKLRRRQVVGSRIAALETLLVLRQVVIKAKFSNINQLINIIRTVGHTLVDAQPKGSLSLLRASLLKEHSVGNIVRKVLHHIREEYHAATGQTASASTTQSDGQFSIAKFVHQGQPRKHHTTVLKASEMRGTLNEDCPDDLDSFAKGLRPVLMEAIQDVLDELETVYDNVSKNAKDHIHSDEIILTLGNSKTVEAFLKSAAHHRNYTAIVAETSPSYTGRELANALSSVGIFTFLVPDSSIYALMSRVNKVILGAHAVLANGGMFAISGSLSAATAAREHSTPVVVCTGQFKLTPLWNLYHEYGAHDFGNPSEVLPFEEGSLVDKVDVLNPYYDYVRPELIDAFITNDGDHPPSSIYRLLKETYDDEDNEL